MSPLQEQLSQLWSDELPRPVADALRQRIATEPEVAREWDRLVRAMEALDALPDELPPPPVRRDRPAPVVARSRWRWAAPVVPLLAAAAVLLVLVPRPAPDLVLASGAQWIEGDVDLRAGDASIAVDGKVWITVEPRDPLPRVGAAKEEPMDRKTVLAGVAGAIVTVAVFEGTAVVRAASGDPVVVSAGETRQVGERAPARVRPPGIDREQNIARLEQELAAVQQELEAAKFEGAISRGQLKALQGTPSPWPENVADAMSPARFRAELEARLAELPDVKVAEVDCDEYPCVAALEYTGTATDDDWNKPLGQAVHGWVDSVLGDQASISVNTSRFRTDDKEARYVIFGASTEGRDTDVGNRTEFRIDAMVDELGQRMHDDP